MQKKYYCYKLNKVQVHFLFGLSWEVCCSSQKRPQKTVNQREQVKDLRDLLTDASIEPRKPGGFCSSFRSCPRPDLPCCPPSCARILEKVSLSRAELEHLLQYIN